MGASAIRTMDEKSTNTDTVRNMEQAVRLSNRERLEENFKN